MRRCLPKLAALVLLAACGPAPGAHERARLSLTDDAGLEVQLAAPAQRIISLLPAVTDLLVALDARGRLVARTEYDRAAELAPLPSVGGGLTPSLEWLTSLRPDLVVAWPDAPSRSVVARLRELGTPVYAARMEAIADYERTARNLGELLGLEAQADSLVRALRASLDSTRAAVAALPRVRVLYLVGLDPPMAAGPTTFLHELIEAAGGENSFADAQQRWPAVSLEEIVRRDPDIVIVSRIERSAGISARLGAAAGWRELSAVRTGRVFEVDADDFNRPGPLLARNARQLAALLHPGLVLPEPTP